MAIQSIVSATFVSAIIAAISNVIAQRISALKDGNEFVIDWVPVFQFFVFACIQTPPNFLWQTLLEDLFPSYHASPTPAAVASAARGDEASLDAAAQRGALVEPRLHVVHTAAKFALDQTVGAAANAWLFGTVMGALQDSMAHAPGAARSVEFLAGGGALDYTRVDWDAIAARTRAGLWPMLVAGWRFWPVVSAANFALVRSVELRNLVGALAGLVWGVYLSLMVVG